MDGVAKEYCLSASEGTLSALNVFYVYCWRNRLNGKRYVGKGSGNRIDHPLRSRASLISKAVKRHGVEMFDKFFIETNLTEDEAYALEAFYVEAAKTLVPNGYNICPGGRGGIRHSNEARQRIGLAKLGKPSGMSGKRHSDKAKTLLSLSLTGRHKDVNHRLKISIGNRLYWAKRHLRDVVLSLSMSTDQNTIVYQPYIGS